jgi:cell division protein FtsA
MRKKTQIITGIDIGTAKTRVLLGEVDSSTNNINIIGYSEKNSEGIIKGEISDLIKASSILNEAVQEAEHNSNNVISPEHLYVSVTGNHIFSKEGASTILIDTESKTVTQSHVTEVLKSTRNQIPPPECMILDTIDGNFIIDDTYHVSDPVGQTAAKLEAHTHIIYANKNRVENYQNLIKDLGFEFSTPVFSGTASALAVLTSDDFDHGTLVINMGNGSTDIVMFNNYTATDSEVLAIGINHIINDLYLGLEIDLPFARDLISTNLMMTRKSQGFSTVEKKGTLKTRNIPIATIEKIIELRLKETFEIIYEKLENANQILNITNGIVLCGGVSYLSGIHDLVRSVFDTPVRSGRPQDVSGPEAVLNSSGFLTAIGLLRYGAHELENSGINSTGSIIRNLDQKLWSIWKKTWRTIIND